MSSLVEKPIVRFPALKWREPVVGRVFENERCIEVPLAQAIAGFWDGGQILDAGCALNGVFQSPPLATVTHLTQNLKSEDQYDQGNRVYVEGDLRDLSAFPYQYFDRVICVSTLEHVGCDNSTYQGPVENDPDSVWKAAYELWRVTRQRLFVTVPIRAYGYRCPMYRSFLPEMLRDLLLAHWPNAEVRYYANIGGGWSGPFKEPVFSPLDDSETDTVQQIAAILVQR